MIQDRPQTLGDPLRVQDRTRSLIRTATARAFAVFAFGATFFGLAMLLVFFVRLGNDVVMWFEVFPHLITERNEMLAEQIRRGEAYIDEELAEIRRFRDAELKAAASDAEKQQIRKEYEVIGQRRWADLEKNHAERLGTARTDQRHDLSAPALLGHFFTSGPSSVDTPQDAGIRPALLGSIFLGIITILFAVPLGVGAAVYLEEYKQTGWLARVIQVNINNLAGVPSVVYGILGAYVFVDLIFRPLAQHYPSIDYRNVLGGGLTLALLTLPVVIVSSQEAIRAVPVSIRHAAIALGATRWQVVRHQVLPNALPGVLTGTILALSRALGEAAPLVLFGALLFVDQNPELFSRFTVMPMQIFNWTGRPQDAWRYNAALASVILLLTLLTLNATAIFLRQRSRRDRL